MLGNAMNVVASADGRRAVLDYHDGERISWGVVDVPSMSLVRTLDQANHMSDWDDMALSADGKWFAANPGRQPSRGVCVWDVDSGELVWEKPLTPLRPHFMAISFTPEGRRLFIASGDGCVVIPFVCPHLGAAFEDYRDLEMGRALGAEGRGLRVTQVESGGPADRAGVRVGDVVVRLAGRPVEEWPRERLNIFNFAVGKALAVELYREGRRFKGELVVANRFGNWAQ